MSALSVTREWNVDVIFTGGKVHEHVRQVGTLGGEFVQHMMRDELDGQLNVAERGAETS